MRGEFGGEWIHVYVWLSPFVVRLKLFQHCLLISYASEQNIKFFLRVFRSGQGKKSGHKVVEAHSSFKIML